MTMATDGFWHVMTAFLLQLACGDGPLTSGEGVCNPFSGFRYLKLADGGRRGGRWFCGCARSGALRGRWCPNLPKCQFTSTGQTGTQGGPVEGAVDNDTSTFGAGDYDVEVGCDCFKDSSIDGQALVLDMRSITSVMRLRLHQGYNAWSVANIRIRGR